MSSATVHPLVERVLREYPERDLTQVELAAELGVAPRTIYNWAKGQQPRPSHRRVIKAWLNGSDGQSLAE